MMLTDATTEELWDALRALDHEGLDNHVTAVLVDELEFRAGEPGMNPAELVKGELYTHHEEWQMHGFLEFKHMDWRGFYEFDRRGTSWLLTEDEVWEHICTHERGNLILRLERRKR